MKTAFISMLCFLIFPPLVLGQHDTRNSVQFPQRIEYDGKTLKRNPAWKDSEIYLEANLDIDSDPEVIIGFIATYKPLEDDIKEEKQEYSSQLTRYLPILQNYSFYQIYDKGRDGYYKLVKTIPGMDRLGRVELVKLDPEDPVAIALFSPGGERYMDLSIYQWMEGGFRLIYNQDNPSGLIELVTGKGAPSIRSCNASKQNGKEIEDCQTLTWDSRGKTFRRSEKETSK